MDEDLRRRMVEVLGSGIVLYVTGFIAARLFPSFFFTNLPIIFYEFFTPGEWDVSGFFRRIVELALAG